MHYKLKDYQVDAVAQTLQTLGICRRSWHQDGRPKSFALSSVTGSGKTVIAATVIEALLHGSTEYDVEADPGAVVLWVSKEPSLNEQTRSRIMDCAERIPVGDLVILDNDFVEDKLEKGNVYFLNTGKLASGNRLVTTSNKRPVTFWEILDNTIKDKSLTLYLILDEAHEGMRPPTKTDEAERQTIVSRIINGRDGSAAVPIVWGISATIKRFNDAMALAENRGTEENVLIDPLRVQQSGLLKSSLVLDIPDEKGDFETSLLRDATLDLVAVSKLWADYQEQERVLREQQAKAAPGAEEQEEEHEVVPLMVVQIPNKEKGPNGYSDEDKTISGVLSVIRKHFPDLPEDAVAHVLGDRDDISVGGLDIPRIKPQDVEGSTHVRVLLAKDAVSTGWDCPRAEVLISLRPAKDHTYITQLLGRMVRTPLARSTGDDRLNSASCYLPHFDRPTAKRIAEEIMGIAAGPAGGPSPKPTGPKVLWSPVDLTLNANVPAEVGPLLANLPSLPKPAAKPRPIKRLLETTAALAQDQLVVQPNKQALEHLYGVLDGAMAQYKQQVEEHAKAIREAEIRQISAKHGASAAEEARDVRDADENTVKEALGHTRRALSVTVTNGYIGRLRLADLKDKVFGEDLPAIQARVAALSRITQGDQPVVVQAVEDAADKKTREWLDATRTTVANLPEDRRAVYEEIRKQARQPEITLIELPSALRVESADEHGQALPTRPKHVLSDAAGEVPLDPKLNDWERQVIDQELTRPTVVAWYRNPATANKHALRIPYQKGGDWHSLQPDFIFIDQNSQGDLTASIVDPHSGHLSDSLDRLRGIADYAEKHGDAFVRIDSLDYDKDKTLRVLEMKDPATRAAVRAATTSTDLFNGPLAHRY